MRHYKAKRHRQYLLQLLALMAFLALASCKQEKQTHLPPKLGPTKPMIDITDTSARSGGTISSSERAPIIDKGLCWGIGLQPTIMDSNKVSAGPGSGSFSLEMQGLSPATTYNARTYATNAFGTSYGNLVTFTTKNPMTPILGVPYLVGKPKHSSAVVLASVINKGGSNIIERGICIDTVQLPSIKGFHKPDYNKLTGEYKIFLSLLPKTLYFLRTYAINASGVAYSKQITFKTPAGPAPTINVPVLTINGSKVNVKVTFQDGGDFAPLTKGICYTNYPPSPYGLWTLNIGLNGTTVIKFKNNPDTGTFSYNLTGLLPDTVYYLCGWAINSRTPKPDTIYGNGIRFQSPLSGLPMITKTSLDTVDTVVVLEGFIQNAAIPAVEKGFVYNYVKKALMPDFSIENSPHFKVATDPGTGYFFYRSYRSRLLSPFRLLGSFEYYTRIKAYAKMANGTVIYGPTACFDDDGPLICPK